MIRHCIALLLLLSGASAAAAEVELVGLIGENAAVFVIGGASPKTIKVGQSFGGVKVISVDKASARATVEVDGKRRVLVRGQTWSSGASATDRQSVTLAAGPGGHFVADGAVNGGAVRFVVDTGATLIALPASVAQRLGIDYRKGQVGTTQTAAGPTPAYRIRLDTVRVGGIELNNVEAIVIESGLPIALLGMSFLNRVEMRHEGERMTLIRRY